jgi:very-short-patch-repair endonuclease
LSRAEHLTQLLRLAGSELERRWLQYLEARSLRLPSRAQALIESCRTQPDFLYEDCQAAIYIDGPIHEFPDRHARDTEKAEALEDHGYTVIRFHHDDDWAQRISRYPHVFGRSS